MISVGCICRGEAGLVLATGLSDLAAARVVGYDVLEDEPPVRDSAEQAGVQIVGSAVIAAVSPARHRVPVLASGSGAGALAAVGRELEVRIEVIGDRPGEASAVKMFRSLLV